MLDCLNCLKEDCFDLQPIFIHGLRNNCHHEQEQHHHHHLRYINLLRYWYNVLPSQARFAQRELDSVCFLGLLGLKLVLGDLGLGSKLVLGDLGLGIIGIGRILCVSPGLNLAPRGRCNLELSSGTPPSNQPAGRCASVASGTSFVPIEGIRKFSSNSCSRLTQVSHLVPCSMALRPFLTPPSGISCLRNLPAFATSPSNMVSGIFFIAN